MYRHNPLPQDLKQSSKRSGRNRQKFVFSSPKLKYFWKSSIKNDQNKLSYTRQRQGSMHKIKSKQKPRLTTPTKRLQRSLQLQQTIALNTSVLQPSLINDCKLQKKYLSVQKILQSHNQSTINCTYQQVSHFKYQQKTQQKQNLPYLTQQNVTYKIIQNQNKRLSARDKTYVDGRDLRIAVRDNFWHTYQGQINNQLMHGYGIIHFIDGTKYQGFFQHDLPHTQGTFYMAQLRQTIHGIWKEGLLIQQI